MTEDQKKQLLQVVNDALLSDKELREKYQIGDKFRFIRDRLQALLARTEEFLTTQVKESKIHIHQVKEDEIIIYVHLYNAQGNIFSTWHKMLNPSVFYEHSVNRPVYKEKSEIEAFIRSKANKLQHAYLAVAVNKADILSASGSYQDALGANLIKVKEGSLHVLKLISFHHNTHEYNLDKEGELKKKG